MVESLGARISVSIERKHIDVSMRKSNGHLVSHVDVQWMLLGKCVSVFVHSDLILSLAVALQLSE